MNLRHAAEDPGRVTAARRHSGRPNFILSGLRGVLKQCWRVVYIDAETYERTIDVEAVKGDRVPFDRDTHRNLAVRGCLEGMAAAEYDPLPFVRNPVSTTTS